MGAENRPENAMQSGLHFGGPKFPDIVSSIGPRIGKSEPEEG